MLKFKKESELCAAVTEILLGLSVTAGRELIAIPEVPWGAYSNEQVDMLLLDVKNQQYLYVEYKLTDIEGLKHQVGRMCGKCAGIINRNPSALPKYSSLFGYTGEDNEIEYLGYHLFYSGGSKYRWSSIYEGHGLKYYWAFKDNKSDLNGGTPGGKKMMLADMYIQAIVNLHKHYGKLDFMITHAMLGEGYSVATSKKYYRQAIK